MAKCSTTPIIAQDDIKRVWVDSSGLCLEDFMKDKTKLIPLKFCPTTIDYNYSRETDTVQTVCDKGKVQYTKSMSITLSLSGLLFSNNLSESGEYYMWQNMDSKSPMLFLIEDNTFRDELNPSERKPKIIIGEFSIITNTMPVTAGEAIPYTLEVSSGKWETLTELPTPPAVAPTP